RNLARVAAAERLSECGRIFDEPLERAQLARHRPANVRSDDRAEAGADGAAFEFVPLYVGDDAAFAVVGADGEGAAEAGDGSVGAERAVVAAAFERVEMQLDMIGEIRELSVGGRARAATVGGNRGHVDASELLLVQMEEVDLGEKPP